MTVSGCGIQADPPSDDVDTRKAPATSHATSTVLEFTRARKAPAGSPFDWAAPGRHPVAPAFCHPPSSGPEYSVPSGPSRYPVADVSASTADVAAPP